MNHSNRGNNGAERKNSFHFVEVAAIQGRGRRKVQASRCSVEAGRDTVISLDAVGLKLTKGTYDLGRNSKHSYGISCAD